MNNMITKRNISIGSKGEIIPPPLTGNKSEEELINFLLEQSPELVKLLNDSKPYILPLAISVYQQYRLRHLFGRRDFQDGIERNIYDSVMTHHIPLSLIPLGDEGASYSTFYPCLTMLTKDGGSYEWQVGLTDYGLRCEQFMEEDPGEAIRIAQEMFVEWAEKEDVGEAVIDMIANREK